MISEIVKYLCELDSNNQIKPGELIEDWFVRLTDVAKYNVKNHKTPPEILAMLAEDCDLRIRCNVA